jgi:DNA-binding IclR family transcriptional regulator
LTTVQNASSMTDSRLTPGLRRNQSLKRAVAILRALAESSDSPSTSELAHVVGLPRPTAARLLATLADAGLAERLQATDGWVLGYEAARLGRAADPYSVLTRRALPHLQQLTESTGESSVLAVTRYPADIEIVSQITAPNLLGVTDWVGRKFGLHASVSGKLAFARLSEPALTEVLDDHPLESYTSRTITDPARLRDELIAIRRRGYATSVDELEMGLTLLGVDVPSGDPISRVVASVGIMGPTSRIVAPYTAELEAIRHCAAGIAELDW